MGKILSKNLIPIAIIIAGLLIAGALVYLNQGKLEKVKEQVLAPQEAADKAIEFISQNLLTGGVTASLVSIVEENGLYKIKMKIQEAEYDSYITKDGSLLFPQGINISETPQSQQQQQEQEQNKATCETLKKDDKPILEAFVVSKCPYGLQMQRILYEVVKNVPSLSENIKVKYIGAIEGNKITSMHGDEEAQENLRQICIREEQINKYWNYIVCHIKKGEVDSCLNQAGVDINKLNGCTTDANRGLKYAKEDFDLQDKYKVTGSPSLFLNGDKVSEFDFGGRTAEALKTLLCCGFQTEPDFCSQKLTDESAATGFSETYTQSSGSSGGSCQ